jgi:hypothetical protein
MDNCYKAKNDYGLNIKQVKIENIKWGEKNALEQAKRCARFGRFYTLMEQEMQHPILLFNNELYNGGLRLMVAVEKGFEYIDAISLNDIKELEKLRDIQRADAKNHFLEEQLEPTEIN